MGRNILHVKDPATDLERRRQRFYRVDWGETVGARVRRLRRQRDWTLAGLASRVPKPGERPHDPDRAAPLPMWKVQRAAGDYGHPGYSAGYFSRLERGWASAPLYVYIKAAEALEVTPGRLLGPDLHEGEFTAQEDLLVKTVRRLGISPHEALARIARGASE